MMKRKDSQKIGFRMPAPQGVVITQDAADSMVGNTVSIDGLTSAQQGTITAVTASGDGSFIDVTLQIWGTS